MPDHIFIQVLMGGAALLMFLSALNLLGSVTTLIRTKTAKIKAETTLLIAMAVARIKLGKNGGSGV